MPTHSFAGRDQRTQAANRQRYLSRPEARTEDPDRYYLCETEPCKPDSCLTCPRSLWAPRTHAIFPIITDYYPFSTKHYHVEHGQY